MSSHQEITDIEVGVADVHERQRLVVISCSDDISVHGLRSPCCWIDHIDIFIDVNVPVVDSGIFNCPLKGYAVRSRVTFTKVDRQVLAAR
jgi:hypothetical protein